MTKSWNERLNTTEQLDTALNLYEAAVQDLLHRNLIKSPEDILRGATQIFEELRINQKSFKPSNNELAVFSTMIAQALMVYTHAQPEKELLKDVYVNYPNCADPMHNRVGDLFQAHYMVDRGPQGIVTDLIHGLGSKEYNAYETREVRAEFYRKLERSYPKPLIDIDSAKKYR